MYTKILECPEKPTVPSKCTAGYKSRGVVPGGAGGAMAALPDFGRSVITLFQPGWTDYVHPIISGTPGFSDLPTALKSPRRNKFTGDFQ